MPVILEQIFRICNLIHRITAYPEIRAFFLFENAPPFECTESTAQYIRIYIGHSSVIWLMNCGAQPIDL